MSDLNYDTSSEKKMRFLSVPDCKYRKPHKSCDAIQLLIAEWCVWSSDHSLVLSIAAIRPSEEEEHYE
jgi:hypothetical protein